jgi:hypothetical protein
MSTQSTMPNASGKARLQLGLVSALCVVGLVAALRPYRGFSDGDTVKVPGLGQRTPIELALLALRMASGLFAVWLLVSIVASIVNLLRARSSTGAASALRTTQSAKLRQGKHALGEAFPRLFGPGWLQQLLRQAAGGTLALALLTGPASAVTRSPQTGTARTALAPVASVLAPESTTVQFAGDVTTGQRWPVLPETSETTQPLPARPVERPTPATHSTAPSTATSPSISTSASTSRPTTSTPASSSSSSSTSTSIPTTPTSTPTSTTPTIPIQPTRPTSTTSSQEQRAILDPINQSETSINRSETSLREAPGHPSNPKPLTPASPSTPTTAVHVVQPGESFWAIAETHVLAHNPQADDHEIARYWEVLQSQNAHRLPAPGVPDLLYPGTELSLPPIIG